MLVLIGGCGDATTFPTAPVQRTEAQGQLLGGLIDGLTSTLVAPLQRSTPLSEPVSWSFMAGPNGATSSNSRTGLTISIPRGALESNVRITVTALEGRAVAYNFQPHGLRFERNVTLRQSMTGLRGGLLSGLFLVGGHFAGDEPDYVSGLAIVNEIVGAQLNLLRTHMSFPITHFSGWIMASGRSESGDSEQ